MTEYTRSNFSFKDDNFKTNSITITVFFIIFCAISNYPLEFWPKSPYFFGTILAVMLFQTTLLCPTEANNYKVVKHVKVTKGDGDKIGHVNQYVMGISLIIWSCLIIHMVNKLLGKRTGNSLSFILRGIVFFIILWWTLSALITVRLIITEN